MKKIGVVGSINADLVCKTNVLPEVGETVVGEEFMITFGGKGANEAVACARLSASVNLLACVGDDMFSTNQLENLKKESVDTKSIKVCKNTFGGVANITVCNKNNSIIVTPGANMKLDKAYIKKETNAIKECGIVGGMLEVPTEALLLASEICVKNDIKFVLNPSPIKDYPKELFDNATFVIVNEIELKEVNGYNPKDPYAVLKEYPNKLIVTVGADGVYYSDGVKIINIPAIEVEVVDTTGAGDTFLGSFMVGINNGLNIADALYFANICAGLKTTKLGAQTGMPKLSEVKKYITKNKINIDIKF